MVGYIGNEASGVQEFVLLTTVWIGLFTSINTHRIKAIGLEKVCGCRSTTQQFVYWPKVFVVF